jgi:hypothetical protein
MRFRAVACLAFSGAAACGDRALPASRDSAQRSRAAKPDSSTVPDSVRRPPQPRVAVPPIIRGLYVNRWAALGDRMRELLDVADRTEVNTLIIDVKDDRGFVLYHSRVPLAREIGADTTRPLSYRRVRALLDSMRAHQIFPVARIVVAKDPLLAEHKTEWAIRRRRDPSKPWLDKNGKPWLDPHQRAVWQYAADLANEAVNLGFSEVQFDYVRFPDEKRLISEATFPLAQGRLRAQVIREQLGFLRQQLAPAKVRVTADVFGLTATDTTDMGIGQRWESFIDQVDVVLPMAYPSHYAPATYGLGNPNAHPYQVIDHTLRDARRRSVGVPNAARVIPWYQDFTLGPPRYGAEQVRAQIRAGYDNGVRSWILWNPRSRYTVEALAPSITTDDLRAAAAPPPAVNPPADSARGAQRGGARNKVDQRSPARR